VEVPAGTPDTPGIQEYSFTPTEADVNGAGVGINVTMSVEGIVHDTGNCFVPDAP
jgi:hypothetical protein